MAFEAFPGEENPWVLAILRWSRKGQLRVNELTYEKKIARFATKQDALDAIDLTSHGKKK